MKIGVQKISREQASALIVTMTLGIVLLVVLASYLVLLTNQKTLVTRSQTWNTSMTMAEAGIEEAMAQLNQATDFSFTNLLNNAVITNFSNNGWGGTSPNFGPKGTNLLGGSYIASIYAATTNGLLSTATIYSTGYTTVPITSATISRKVKVIAETMALFNVGVGAVSNISWTGGGNGNQAPLVNSWPGMTNGVPVPYSSSLAQSNGNVASQFGIVAPAGQTIAGNLYLGPNATVTGTNNISGSTYYNYNVEFPDVVLPPGANSWPTATTTNTSVTTVKNSGATQTAVVTAYDFKTSGNYIVNQDHAVIVEAGVTVNLNVTATTWSGSGVNLNGTGTNTGTAVFFFNGPSSVTVAANTSVNPSGNPENLWYFGLPSLTSITYNGNSDFAGVIYAPEVNMTLNGGGNGQNIMGSVIVNSIQDNGHFDFHYDQDLGIHGPSRGFVAYSWQEL